ncbi:MAG TPA: phosphatase PAP2 family protein [Candidatus Binatia bacterium]|nr:phosphatase PAP2 family protein [Candidatus Binatia bacterium]
MKRTAGTLDARGLLLGSLLCLGAFVLVLAVVLLQGLDGTDAFVRGLVHPAGPTALRPWMERASFWGGEPGQLAITLGASCVLWRARRRWSVALPAIMAGAGLLQLVAKWAVGRPRPNLDPWGFPSAHVLSLVVLLGFIAYLFATSQVRRGFRLTAVGACMAMVFTVAFSRMYLDAHWFSDVLGGFSMGLGYLFGALWLIQPPVLAFAETVASPASDELVVESSAAA